MPDAQLARKDVGARWHAKVVSVVVVVTQRDAVEEVLACLLLRVVRVQGRVRGGWAEGSGGVSAVSYCSC